MDLLTYKQLLYFLNVFFKDGEFDSAEVSRAFFIFLAPVDSKHIFMKRFSSRLMSNGLRRLSAWELVARTGRRVPIEFVTKSGKTGHRGGHFKYRITAKGFRVLAKTPVAPMPLNRMMFISDTRDVPEFRAMANIFPNALPPILKEFKNRRPQRLPNRVTFGMQTRSLAETVRPHIEDGYKQLLNDVGMLKMREEGVKREAERREFLEKPLKKVKEMNEEISGRIAMLTVENGAKKSRIIGELLRKLEPWRNEISKISPDAEELMKKLYAEEADTQEPDAGQRE